MTYAGNWIGAVVAVVLLLALIGYWVRQLTIGGVLTLGGLLVGAIADQRAVIVPAGLVLTAGIVVLMAGEPLGRRLDRRRTERIHRGLHLD